MGDDRHTHTGVDLGDLILVFGDWGTLEWHCSFSLFDSERYVIPRPVLYNQHSYVFKVLLSEDAQRFSLGLLIWV